MNVVWWEQIVKQPVNYLGSSDSERAVPDLRSRFMTILYGRPQESSSRVPISEPQASALSFLMLLHKAVLPFLKRLTRLSHWPPRLLFLVSNRLAAMHRLLDWATSSFHQNTPRLLLENFNFLAEIPHAAETASVIRSERLSTDSAGKPPKQPD